MKIIYRGTDNSISVIIPNADCEQAFGIMAIAKKDVPEGLPFWIVDESEIPTDRTFRNAWEIPEDWGPPDGYGSEFYTFEKIEEEKDVEDQPTESD